MELYGQYDRSIPQKILIHTIEIVLIFLSWWILFGDGSQWMAEHLPLKDGQGASARRTVIFVFHVVIFIRLGFAMLFLLKRRIPWEESISIPFAFAIYYIGFSILVLPSPQKLGTPDMVAILLFISGCGLNSLGEIQRHIWKKKPGNKGKLYTAGLFRYSRHINYFGDLVWVTAYAILTRNPWSFLIPVWLFCFFAFFNAPKLDKYLKEKYKEAYDDYAAKTRMLIPFLY